MQGYYNPYFANKKKEKPIIYKIMKFFIFGLIFDRIIYYAIQYYLVQNNISYISFLFEFFNKLSLALDLFFYISIELIIIILIEYAKSKKEISRSKFLLYEAFFSGLWTLISLLWIFSYYQVIDPSIITFLNNLFLVLLSWMIKILVFFGLWIGIILYYIIKNYYMIGSLKYRLYNFEIDNFSIIFHSKNKKMRGICILEVKNIPKKISTRENRIQKKNIERITFGDKQVYFHYHLTVLMNYIPNVSYEISVHKNRVRFRLILTIEKKNKDELMDELKNLANIVSEIYQTSFPGLTFELLKGNRLHKAWSEIIGGIGNYKLKYLKEGTVMISQVEKNLFLKIIEINEKPQVKAFLKRTQIDSLISSLLGSNIYSCSFIIHADPVEIYKFKNKDSKFQDFNMPNWKYRAQEKSNNVRQNLLDTRHSEITGIWNVSAYLILRALNERNLANETKKVMAILDTVFSGNENSIKTEIVNKNKIPFILSLIINRQGLKNRVVMTSEQLAAYFHLPEESFPSIERSNIPLFEIPTEDAVNEKITIGTILFQNNKELFKVGIDIEDLRLNMFVTGLIGMGKTTFVMNILKKLAKFYSNINWIVLDWKGDYVSLIKEIPNKILVLRPGTKEAPFQINMFDPENSNVSEHGRKLLSLFIELFKSDFSGKPELSVQMERVCREVIEMVMEDTNNRSLNRFFECLDEYLQENRSRNPSLTMTINAIINRFDRFRRGILKNIFDVKKTNINFEDIMDCKVIFDFNYLLSNGGTKEDVRFLMNLILKYIIDKALQRGITNELKHLVIIEDSQLLVPAILREVPETSMGEDIPLLLRGVGEGMITIATRPEISPDIISNSGIKVSFKSTYDSKKIANYQNLNQEQEEYLRVMPKREAIITLPSFQYPFRIKTEDAYFRKCSNREIYENNRKNFPLIYEDLQKSDLEFLESSEKASINLDDASADAQINTIPLINQKIEHSNNDLENKILTLVKESPKNKYQISDLIGFEVEDIEKILLKMIRTGKLNSFIAPVFHSGKVQKLYTLNGKIKYIENEIKLKIEKDLVSYGTFGYSGEKLFDYIWYAENIFVKLYVQEYNTLEKNKFAKFISDTLTNAINNNSYELIIIIPFIQWKDKITKWLKDWNINSVYVFSYNKKDWEHLHYFLKNKDLPVENIEKNNNPRTDFELQNNNIIKIASNELKSINTTKNKKSNYKTNKNIKPKEKIDHNKLIQEILLNFKGQFPVELLERFESEFPNDLEICNILNCDRFSLYDRIKPIRKYIKEVQVHDIDDPVGTVYSYFGWRDTIKGKFVMRNIIGKIFSENNISFQIQNNPKSTINELYADIILPKHQILIILIYEDNDSVNIREIISKNNKIRPDFNNIIIAYSTEIKNSLERKIKNWGIKNLKILKFDWIEINPWINKLTHKK
ncbi:MAG: ATP-binding protein [Candidatus Helarchaeota archaeon]